MCSSGPPTGKVCCESTHRAPVSPSRSPPYPARRRVVAAEPAAEKAPDGRRSSCAAMTPDSAGVPVRVLAQYLAADDHVWRRLLALHVEDGTGHCAGCRSAAGGTPVWPCTLYALALEVQARAARQGCRQSAGALLGDRDQCVSCLSVVRTTLVSCSAGQGPGGAPVTSQRRRASHPSGTCRIRCSSSSMTNGIVSELGIDTASLATGSRPIMRPSRTTGSAANVGSASRRAFAAS